MRFPVRISLLALVITAVCALLAPASWGAEGFGVEKFEAGTCNANPSSEPCTYKTEPFFYTTAAGHPPFGITYFKFNTEESSGLSVPQGKVKDIRVDLPPGLSVNPQAVEQCSEAELVASECAAHKGAEVGLDEIETIFEVLPGVPVNLTIPFKLFNIEPPEGHPAEFGFNTPFGPVYLVGGISWNTDYHEYFVISEVNKMVPFIGSKLVTHGNIGTNGFLTLPSACSETEVSHLEVDSWEKPGEWLKYSTETPVGVTECQKVPFEPSIAETPSTTQSDRPDGLAVDVKVPQNPEPTQINSSTLRNASVTLPEGMTLNPSAATGLEACTDAQIGIGTENQVSCPAGSKVGTVAIETPTLPKGALTGNVYVGQPLSTEPASGREYRIFVDAEAPRYGVSVRLEGRVQANATTGRLTTTFTEAPPIPFSDFIITLDTGEHAPLANPLACGAATTTSSITPYSGNPPAAPGTAFAIDSNGKGGTCAKPLPFSPAQATQVQPNTAGAYSSYTLGVTREEGQQYLSQIKTTLPRGLLAAIPAVPLCGEPQAQQGTCSAASAIGSATVALGAGPHPFGLTGTVYLTGPYGGAPYGLSIVVPAEKVGPYNDGVVVTRAKIEVDKYTARVIVTAAPPTIVSGVPVRLRSVTVAVNRNAYLFNPTNCSALSTDTALSGFTPGTSESALAMLSTPFQVTNCSALAFKPTFASSTDARTSSKTNGISLVTTITQPAHEANIASVFVSLPKILPSRLTTLQQACLAATFEANPASCPAGSLVGSVAVSTPVLPTKLTGPAYLVSHGNAAFPDLDLILRGSGVEVILVGTTNIVNGITTTNFASLPDVPVSSVEVNLPVGPHSALQAEGNICAGKLVMPTKITAQSGAVINQNTTIHVKGCAAARHAHLRVLRYKVHGHRVTLTISAPSAGRLSASGNHLRGAHRRLKHGGKVKLTLRLTRAGVRALHRHHHITIRIRVSLAPTHGRRESAHVKVRFPPRRKHARHRR